MTHHIYELDICEYSTRAWHGLGTVHGQPFLPNERVTQWPEFEKRDTYVVAGSDVLGNPQYAPTGASAIVRSDNPSVVLNDSVTDRFGIPDYSWMDEFAEEARERGLFDGFESLLTMHNGRLAAASFKVGDDIWIGEDDKLEHWVNLFDGVKGIPCGGKNGLGRVVCNNTFQAYILSPKAQVLFSERHTTNVQERIALAWQALLETIAQETEVKSAVERLINESYAEWEFHALTRELIGEKPETKRGATIHENKRKAIVERYNGEDLDHGLRYTKFGALMAIQGYEQHVAPVRGVDRETRHLETLLNGSQTLTNRASQILVGA